MSQILESFSEEERADLNNDGTVNVADLLDLLGVFGSDSSGGGVKQFDTDEDNITFSYE